MAYFSSPLLTLWLAAVAPADSAAPIVPPPDADAAPPSADASPAPDSAADPGGTETSGPPSDPPPAASDPPAATDSESGLEPGPATDAPPEAAPSEPAPPPAGETVNTFTSARPEAHDPEARHQLSRPSEDVEDEEPEFNRQGFMMSMSVGISGCRTDCALFRVGGSGRLGLGYRYNYVGFGVAASIGGAQYTEPDDMDFPSSKGSIRYLEVGPFFQVFPVSKGRIDPFVEVGLGFFRFTDKGTVDDIGDSKYEYWLSRPAVRLGVGFPLYVRPRFSIGPRFDQTIGFAGKVCADVEDVDFEEECVDVSEAVEDASEIESRQFRRSLPRPWSLTLDARFVF